ncbi:hypothetical protein Peur_020744 [Populus x canadensis]
MLRTRSSSAILIGGKPTTEDHNVNKKSRKQSEVSGSCPPPVKASAPNRRGQTRKKIDSVATDDSEVFVPIKKRITVIGHKHPTKKQEVEIIGSRKAAHSLCVICCEKKALGKCPREANAFMTRPDPECDESIEPGTFRSIVPLAVLDRWQIALGKSTNANRLPALPQMVLRKVQGSMAQEIDVQEVSRNDEELER